MLEDAEADILAFYAFPSDDWRKLPSTNPLERFNREIGRRSRSQSRMARRSPLSLGRVDLSLPGGTRRSHM
jgi:transposase-like protein